VAIDFKNTQEYMGGGVLTEVSGLKTVESTTWGFDKRDWLREKVLGSEMAGKNRQNC